MKRSEANGLKMRIILRLALTAAIALIALAAALPAGLRAEGYLDEIQRYVITVDIRSDGTLDMLYHFEWKVLDDSSEGPLEWVKIGIANASADEIRAVSANIRNIGYLSDGGDYVRIDFDRSYYADEIITFEFSLHQSNIYKFDTTANKCRYSFKPGWFEEIAVKEMTIRWNKANVFTSDAPGEDGDYLVWTQPLEPGAVCQANVTYLEGTFTTHESMPYATTGYSQYTSPDYTGTEFFYEDPESSGNGLANQSILPVMGFIGAIGFIIYRVIRRASNDDGYNGGFGGPRYFGGGGGGIRSCACVSQCACASSCACACACAGGGRAGCSAKGFYGVKIRLDDLKKSFDKK
jgi:hypothetical protein